MVIGYRVMSSIFNQRNLLRSVTVFGLACAVAACAPKSPVEQTTLPTTTSPTEQSAETQQDTIDRVVVDGKVLPLPKEREITTYTLPQERSVSPVVQNLIKKAQGQSQSGNYDSAANSLERALRIEPRNAKLWHRLAGVRYLQELWQKAIQLAAKSNTLAGNNKTLRRENWYLMSNSHKALGNTGAEKKYRDKLSGQLN